MTNNATITLAAKDTTGPVFERVRAQILGLGTATSGVVGRLGAFAPALAGAFSTAGLLAFVKGANDGLLALKDIAEATGSTVESISALEDVAARTGTELGTVSQALVKFNSTLASADAGSDTARILQAIGLSAADLKREDPAEALRRTAVALAQFADDGDRARIVQQLFGKSVREVAPLLNDLAEQGALVATVTRQQADEAERFANELATLQKNATDVARDLSGPLIRSLNATVDKFREGREAGRGFFATLAREQLKLLGINPGGRASFSELPQADYSNEGRRARRAVGPVPEPRPAAAARAALRADSDDAAQYLRTLQQQIAGTQELTQVEKTLAEIRTGRFTFDSKVSSARLLDLAAEIAATKEAQRVAAARSSFKNADFDAGVDAARQNAQAEAERLRSLLAGTETEVFKRQQADIEFLRQALERGAIAANQYAEGVRGIVGVAEEAGEKTKSLAEDLGLTFTSAFEDAIVGGNGLRDVLKGLEADILRIVTRRLITEPLGNAISGALKGGGFGGFLSSLLPGFFGGGRAAGGPVSAGGTYLVGEKGPELLSMGPRSGTIVPNSALGGMAITLAPNIMIDARSDQAQVAQLVAAGMAQAQQSMWRQLKARGLA